MTKKELLIESFENAIEQSAKYVFTEIDLGYEATELIINPIENAQVKLEYLCKTYDDDLKHPHAPVSIVSFGFVDNLSQLEYVRANFDYGVN